MLQYVRSWLVYAIAMAVIIPMIWSLVFSDHGYFVYQNEQEHQVSVESDIQRLLAEKEKITADIIRFREDPKVLEEMIHRELGYVYPDEYMLIMPESKIETEKRSGNE